MKPDGKRPPVSAPAAILLAGLMVSGTMVGLRLWERSEAEEAERQRHLENLNAIIDESLDQQKAMRDGRWP